MAIEAGDFKTGLTVMVDGDPWVVLEFMHVKPGKGAAILKTKMRNLKTGSTQERNFNANTKFEPAMIEKKAVNYSYEAGGTYSFMDMETYETYDLSTEQIGDNKYFLKEGMECYLMIFNGDILNVQLPDKVELTVAETTPGVKGANSSQTKDATTDTGLTLRVPQFINTGDVIIVTTADGKYSSRA
ncbi:MAG: elongation factor P [Galactobacillus timonensis]|jgi:elongation factor P|uniref:elongation factor P n=1 Tax=Galactobacillus timonensis TaxID=2041840 RepID=UPI00240932A5|nr:elongation factor P [Galactobacillus timonensis]MDD5852157.1 elongation factor P [Galactobacillus timonensis]MDD6370781.1 elongation factor P [Galactobacillus timonensis]MDD6599355.1 elongation factor P [Galactobacillus timonensis]MDD6679664.1 elongation factor P [Galactobacillus timonensis]